MPHKILTPNRKPHAARPWQQVTQPTRALLLVMVATVIHAGAAEVDVFEEAEPITRGIVLDARVTTLPELPLGPYIHLDDGKIMGIDGNNAIVSDDGGKTWTPSPIFGADQNMIIRAERALFRTRSGTIILLFINDAVKHYSWDKKKNLPNADMLLPSYAIRSLDNGKTWVDLTELHGGWCGCLQDIIQTKNGNLVVPGQELRYDKGRHATMPYVSTDDGKTWLRTQYLDIPGQGDHAGAIEGTVEQLKDGRLWMLIRSYHGFFYESYSSDDGLTWSAIKPSAITSTGSPGKLQRLASGRLLLLWNAIPNEGYVRREELFISFSEDEGKTWSPARVIARNKGGRLSYIHAFEATPGELWITTMQGDLRARLYEKDFLGPWTPIVAFGDSTTATRNKVNIYANVLERELPEHGVDARVFNAGVPGNNTEQARKRFQADVLDRNPEIVIIQFGINDSAIDVWANPPATQPRLAKARYRENLEYFIAELKARDMTPILMTPNPMRWAERTLELYGKPPYLPDDVDGFNVVLQDYVATAREVAAETGVKLVDVYTAFQAYDTKEGQSMDDLMLDGMHPNSAGHRLVAKALMDTIGAGTGAAE